MLRLNEETEFNLSEDFYHHLYALTIDPKIELEKLYYLSVVTGNTGKHGVFWFKEVYIREGLHYARVQLMFPVVEDKLIAVKLMDELAKLLKESGIPIKR